MHTSSCANLGSWYCWTNIEFPAILILFPSNATIPDDDDDDDDDDI
jgi:hypothetical protein